MTCVKTTGNIGGRDAGHHADVVAHIPIAKAFTHITIDIHFLKHLISPIAMSL
ncbi:MAG: hypothetical protein ACI8XZ_005446 [Gammaproteobacteria bacterium]